MNNKISVITLLESYALIDSELSEKQKDLLYSYFRESILKNDNNQRGGIITKEDADKTLQDYYILRQSTVLSLNLINSTINDLTGNNEDFSRLIAFKKQFLDLKNVTKNERTVYISFNVVSPVLMKVNVLLNIYSNSGFMGIDKDKYNVNELTKIFRLAGGENLILGSSESVKDQFFHVYKEFKKLFGDAEYKELEVLQVISESIQKNGSGDEWWP